MLNEEILRPPSTTSWHSRNNRQKPNNTKNFPSVREPRYRMEHPVAKATFARSQALWKIFWMRADLKWHGYEPLPAVGSIEKFLAVVEKDEHACFWG